MRKIMYAFVVSSFCLACDGNHQSTDAHYPESAIASASVETDHLPAEILQLFQNHTESIPVGKHLSYDLVLNFGGQERFRGSIRQSPSMDRIVMKRADGAELRYDGTQVALMKKDTSQQWPNARFAAFTWPYFFAAPMKLADPGTRWGEIQEYAWFSGEPAQGAKLSFAKGTGDAPDDYYIVIPNAEQRLDGMAYVVTFGKTDAQQAEASEPHAIRYHDYLDVGGVPIAQRWTFHNWLPGSGLDTSMLGSATIANIRWVAAEQEAYAGAGGEIVPAPKPD